MTVPLITQAEIDNVVVTREGTKLTTSLGLLKQTALMDDMPDTIRTRAVMLLALANYIDHPPKPPFEFPKNHASVILADTPMRDGKTSTARFTRIENQGWFSAAYGWQAEDAILRSFENLRVVSEGIPGNEGPTPDEQAVTE